MPRRIEVSASSDDCARILREIEGLDGIARITLQRDVSLAPKGDALTIDLTNSSAIEVMDRLRAGDLLERVAVTLSEPTAMIRASETTAIEQEGNDAAWEEIGAMMRQDTNPSFNFLALMALAGAVASFGIVSDTIHSVIGAMLIAPGFEPLLRIVFGISGDKHSAGAGVKATIAGYAALGLAAALAVHPALHFQNMRPGDLPTGDWVGYWSQVTGEGIATSFLAGIAGGIIISTRMKVLSTGVMVALALVPSFALIGMGLAAGEVALAGQASLRWLAEVACVMIGGGTVIASKRWLLHLRQNRAA
jgi:hypothetical protein